MSFILVVDDEAGIRELLQEILQDEGYRVKLAENATAARAIRAAERPDLVLLDIWMPDTDGITLLKEWKGSGLLTMPVVMMSGHGTIDTAVEATKIGALDFLEKPVTLQKLLSTVEKALKRNELQFRAGLDFARLGSSEPMQMLKRRLTQVGHLKMPVLFTGEDHIGIEWCARYLHQPETPWHKPESIEWLANDPLSVGERVRNGLLFLAEIAELSRMEQKGLWLLLGKLEKFNARLICATRHNLSEKVAAGTFDQNLFFALCGITLAVPSLESRRDDIPDIARMMLAEWVESHAASHRSFSTAALNALRNAEWPGHMAQLSAVVSTLAHTALNEEISHDEVLRTLAQFTTETRANNQALPLDLPLREARDAFERVYFEHLLARFDGSMSRVSAFAEVERTHLYRKLKALGIHGGRKGEE